eukprot:365310-Chlamydomonas_euryale.AAC.1
MGWVATLENAAAPTTSDALMAAPVVEAGSARCEGGHIDHTVHASPRQGSGEVAATRRRSGRRRV